MNETIKKQILAIRDTGLTNMFDTNVVQRLAYERDFYELVVFVEEHRKEYVHFILYCLSNHGKYSNLESNMKRNTEKITKESLFGQQISSLAREAFRRKSISHRINLWKCQWQTMMIFWHGGTILNCKSLRI